MALLTLTVNNLATPLEKKFQEVQLIDRVLQLAATAIHSAGGLQTSGNVMNDGATVILGSWTYTPQASS